MRILDLFRRSRIDVVSPFEAGDLGLLIWSTDEESWQGSYQGQTFFVFPSRPSQYPTAEVLEYAESMLKNRDWLKRVIEDEKRKYIGLHPEYEAELHQLGIDSLAFSIHKRKGTYMNCQLGYGAPDRFWSLDFHDRTCTGMGFDT